MSLKRLYRGFCAQIRDSRKESLSDYLNCCKYTMTGNTEIVIEGSISVSEYTDTVISFYERSNLVSVYGRNMELCYLKPNTARINGFICSIVFSKDELSL